MNEKFPGIEINEAGICNFCLRASLKSDWEEKMQTLSAEFMELVGQHRKRGGYDCVVAYSGGKDSTYVLHLLKTQYRLNILAYSYDNWFQSERAQKNIRTVLEKLSIDHFTVLPSFETIRRLLLHTIEHPPTTSKALTRASAICTSCISLIRFMGLRLAVEWQAPFFVMGMTPGQASLATAVVQMHPPMLKAAQDLFLRLIPPALRPRIQPLILEARHFEDSSPLYSINPLAFESYDEARIMDVITDYGWEKPQDTDANSTNCLLNAFANQLHKDMFGFNPYSSEIAELVRSGRLSREEGLERLEAPFSEAQIRHVKERLGMTAGHPLNSEAGVSVIG